MLKEHSERDWISVVVGIIYDAQRDAIFITQRRSSVHLAGMYEFPGGKVAEHETEDEALRRELLEEVGIEVQTLEKLTTQRHHYETCSLQIAFYLVSSWRGEPVPQEGQNGGWQLRHTLHPDQFPEANRSVIQHILHTVDPKAFKQMK